MVEFEKKTEIFVCEGEKINVTQICNIQSEYLRIFTGYKNVSYSNQFRLLDLNHSYLLIETKEHFSTSFLSEDSPLEEV